jgi:hypothetical protein
MPKPKPEPEVGEWNRLLWHLYDTKGKAKIEFVYGNTYNDHGSGGLGGPFVGWKDVDDPFTHHGIVRFTG